MHAGAVCNIFANRPLLEDQIINKTEWGFTISAILFTLSVSLSGNGKR